MTETSTPNTMKIHQTPIRSAQTLCAGRDDSIGNGDRVRMREHGRHQTTVVTISGEVDAANSDRVREFASRPILVGNPLILDLSGVKFFAARAISTLIALDDACRVTAVPWAIVPSRTVNRVLRLTDCATSLPAASSVPEALHQLTTGTCCCEPTRGGDHTSATPCGVTAPGWAMPARPRPHLR